MRRAYENPEIRIKIIIKEEYIKNCLFLQFSSFRGPKVGFLTVGIFELLKHLHTATIHRVKPFLYFKNLLFFCVKVAESCKEDWYIKFDKRSLKVNITEQVYTTAG